MSSLENISSESVTCLAFVDSYTKKSGKFDIDNLIHFFFSPPIFGFYADDIDLCMQLFSISQIDIISILSKGC